MGCFGANEAFMESVEQDRLASSRKMLLYMQLSVRIKRSMWTCMTQGSVMASLTVCRMLMIDC